jgi:hypothetical protein
MIPKALRRAGTSWKIFLIAAALFCVGVAGSTTALFTADVTNKTSTFGGGWVGSPTGASAAGPQGAQMTVTWTTPTTTGVQGYAVVGTNVGTTATACPTTPYATTITTLVAPASSYTATNAASQSDDGYYYCYQVRSYWTTNSWYGATPSQPASATRIGLYPTSASITNGDAHSGGITKKDSISVTFNQAVTVGTTNVISCTNGTVLIGASACGTTPSFGTLTTNGSITTSTTWGTTVTGSGTTTVSFALTGNNSSNDTGTFTFTPSASLLSSTGAATEAPACTAAQCTISAGGPF